MNGNLKPSSRKVQEFVSSNNLDTRAIELEASTRTAAQAAKAVGCELHQIAKPIGFKNPISGEAIRVIASGPNRVDVAKVEASIGGVVEKAEAKFVREKTGVAIGGVPPFAHHSTVFAILDQDLRNLPVIWAAAGTPNTLFSIEPAILAQLTAVVCLETAEARS